MLDAAYDVIIERVNAYAAIEGGELSERLINKLNSVISKYSAIVNTRLGGTSNRLNRGLGSGQAREQHETAH